MSMREWLQAELQHLKKEAKVWSKWTDTGVRPQPNRKVHLPSATKINPDIHEPQDVDEPTMKMHL